MKDRDGYGQFCPVAMAAEIICTKWTALVLREMLCGSRRFSDIRRGVPLMSPTLLSTRLAELEKAGIITRSSTGEYELTAAGEDLRPVIMELGAWGHRWVESSLSLKNLDPGLLMWDMRRHLRTEPLPSKRCTILFHYPELNEAQQNYWLVVEHGVVDVCAVDPGHEVNLYVTSSLRAMTMVWMGLTSLAKALASNEVQVEGDREIAKAMESWLGLSPFASIKRKSAA